ncbi:translational GTPase TypA [Candidatus Woesebacteria bacterium]|nr:translational GTPase TypA [Candidatus Woesebacteria bacterium]HNV45023.1 translational GTPase TypA [Candidatus Woesebacteria bacterium]HOA12200.1 translational GTPase TypA [Candidatus Woesebacteria bacterium]HPA62222.1 translational GTPase TypA [Candidatus Woesebacteria bacterium]HQL11077.1 translational GTPase TypA [Candidatus Woesebacteria bacterium]
MQIRNVAIIAHVDHGKTTLIDGMLKQTHTFRENQAEMSQETILDSNDLEREKGITILAKNTSINYRSLAGEEIKINIIDTPGHADFAGEVERVISMADGAILLVDAAEGPLPQTKFVLQQAIKRKLPIIVLINKIDRQDSEPERVLNQVEELFLSLADDSTQLDFPVLYSVGRMGKIWSKLPEETQAESLAKEPGNLQLLFEEIVKSIPAPQTDPSKPFKMQVSTLDFDSYKGVYAIGKVTQGIVKAGQRLVILQEDQKVGEMTVTHLMESNGLNRQEIKQSRPGDIIAITGVDKIAIGQTLAALGETKGFPMIKITEPTLKIQIAANTSPFVGRESEFCTVRQLADRLKREQKTNLGLRIEQKEGGVFIVAGRGELHLSVLIETMRREGYEMEVSRPQVIFKEIDGVKQEPVEELIIEIEQDYLGIITEELGKRHAQLQSSFTNSKGICRMVYQITSRNLLGFRSEILTKTKGNGLFTSSFLHYAPLQESRLKLRNGALIATETGTVTAYALESVQQRGKTFVVPGEEVYEGQIVGLCKQKGDLEVNVCKNKKLTNFRSNAEVMTVLNSRVELSLEQCLDFIENDELLEVTPKNLRLRKRYLNKLERNKKMQALKDAKNE